MGVTPDQYLSLGDLAGRPVILAFYPADWSPVCRRPDGHLQSGASGIPPDMEPSSSGYRSTACGAMRPLPRTGASTSPACGFRAEGDVARRYGAYRADEGVCERALFVIDQKGVVSLSYLSPIAAIRTQTAFSTRWKSFHPRFRHEQVQNTGHIRAGAGAVIVLPQPGGDRESRQANRRRVAPCSCSLLPAGDRPRKIDRPTKISDPRHGPAGRGVEGSRALGRQFVEGEDPCGSSLRKSSPRPRREHSRLLRTSSVGRSSSVPSEARKC